MLYIVIYYRLKQLEKEVKRLDDLIYMGRVLKHLRNAKGMSQEQMSLQCDINLSYYSKIERGIGNPSMKKLFTILSALDVTPEEYWYRVALEKHRFIRLPAGKYILASEE